MSMRGIRTVLFGLGLASSIAACEGPGGPVQAPTEVRVHRNALEGDGAACSSASVVPAELEGELADCLNVCNEAADGETCARTCCEEVTGCEQCSVEFHSVL